MPAFSPNKKAFSDDIMPIHCDRPGCHEAGLYRAPQDRSLKSYYHFCLNHIREYNKSWNYYAGLTMDDIERLNTADIGWQRPTWPLGNHIHGHEQLRRATDQFLGESTPQQKLWPYLNAADLKALETLEASPPYTQKSIKKAYKALIKKHHPDSNNGSKDAEERIIRINDAYTILKNNPHIQDQ